MSRAREQWTAILATMTGRGFKDPPFKDIVLAPPVKVDFCGVDPPREAMEAENIRPTLEQKPS